MSEAAEILKSVQIGLNVVIFRPCSMLQFVQLPELKITFQEWTW